jgi:hypothetical protein
MPTSNEPKTASRDRAPRQSERSVETTEDTPVIPSGPVIELGDLSTGPEAEVDRLKSSMSTLYEEMNQIRGQHAGLASDYQKLTGELRDIKLILAKAHAKELSAIEGRNCWVQSLNRLREIFRTGSNPHKNIESKSNRTSSLDK